MIFILLMILLMNLLVKFSFFETSNFMFFWCYTSIFLVLIVVNWCLHFADVWYRVGHIACTGQDELIEIVGPNEPGSPMGTGTNGGHTGIWGHNGTCQGMHAANILNVICNYFRAALGYVAVHCHQCSSLFHFIGTAPRVCRALSVKQYGVCLSVCPAWAHSSKPAFAGLLLWARWAGDIDRLCSSSGRMRAVPRCQHM